MKHHHLLLAGIVTALAGLGAACSRDVLHTGAAGATVTPAIPVPIHPGAGGTCDSGVDACSASGTPGTQGTGQGGACDPGLVACPGPGAGYCFDLQSSPEHCGACDHACALGSPCENGQCRVVHCTSHMSTRSVPAQGVNYGGYGMAPTDCNRDGNLDLLTFGPPVAPKQSKSVGVLQGNGDGTFTPAERYAIDVPYWQGYSITVADLNRDQVPDLIILVPLSDMTTAAESQRFGVIVRLGHGDCTFGPEISLDAGAGIINIAVGDLDGDDIPDLAVSATDQISTFHGNGDGSFSNRQDFEVGGSPSRMVVTDWNSDGIPDVVADDGYLHVLLGTGGGHFAPALDCALKLFDQYRVSTTPPVIADFDGDGVPDLASKNIILFGMHDCNSTRQVTFATPSPPYNTLFFPLTAGDFNGDGAVDLVFASAEGFGFVPGDGHGNFGAVVMLGDLGPEGTSESTASTYVGDFNGDGRLDMVAAGGNSAQILVNTCQ